MAAPRRPAASANRVRNTASTRAATSSRAFGSTRAAGASVPTDSDAALRDRLLDWYGTNARDLPWRRRRDPYAIWVSEVMLQQTQVATVVPYYEAWLRRFPDVAALAAAPESDVLAAWSGLGYYRRARFLHAGAKVVVQRHGGTMPATVAALLDLPGVGTYTAGAIASIAHGTPAAAVDGNVIRVLSRLRGLRGVVTPARLRAIGTDAAALVAASGDPGAWNQALMELGATVCTPRAPSCAICPVRATCIADAKGLQSAIPPPKDRATPKAESWHVAVVRSGRHVLLREEPEGGLLGGCWLPPRAATLAAVGSDLRSGTGIELPPPRGAPTGARHVFSHRVWNLRVHAVQIPRRRPVVGHPWQWVEVAALDRATSGGLAIPAVTNLCVAATTPGRKVSPRRRASAPAQRPSAVSRPEA